MDRVIVVNAPQVIAALEAVAIRVDVADEVVEKAAAEIVAGFAAKLAPRLTGFLKASVDESGGKVVADADYAGYVEWGSRHAPAQPFMRPAKTMAEPFARNVAERIYTSASR